MDKPCCIFLCCLVLVALTGCSSGQGCCEGRQLSEVPSGVRCMNPMETSLFLTSEGLKRGPLKYVQKKLKTRKKPKKPKGGSESYRFNYSWPLNYYIFLGFLKVFPTSLYSSIQNKKCLWWGDLSSQLLAQNKVGWVHFKSMLSEMLFPVLACSED